MSWFSRREPLHEKLLAALVEERKVSERLQLASLDAVTKAMASAEAQSAMTREWLGMLNTSSTPQVRVMTELDEYAHDKARLDAAGALGANLTKTPIEPEEWAADLRHTFADMKAAFGS